MAMNDDARCGMIPRRELLRIGACAGGALVLSPACLWAETERRTTSYLDDARAAGAWLLRHAVNTSNGLAWPVTPDTAKDVATNLYTGNAGVVLFLLELHAATGEAKYRDAALAGALELASSLSAPDNARRDFGLYTGIAGLAFTLGETHRALGDERLRTAARAASEQLETHARRARNRVDWGPSIDIISGSAGTGLYLLHAHRTLGVQSALDLAVQAGHRIVALGQPAAGGVKWAPSAATSATTLYPNFSHGTAGVGYFLTRLYATTRETTFLDAARAAARYLDAVATRAGGGELIFHHEPGGEDLFYLGWCHGPAGTARFYRALADATGEPVWEQKIQAGARAVLLSGVPERRTPGFWNNVSQCCGDAAVGEFFLSLHRLWPKQEYIDMVRRVASRLRSSATRDGDGLKWIQAEHRVRPTEVFAQTGLMQGAAGIGLFFARLAAYERGRAPFVQLPDTPFA
jgi:lantibiotic modifying enzyme